VNVLDVFDLAATAFLLAQGIGRWGNFINQEAYGTFTGSSWFGMMSNRTIIEMGAGLVHPCFLYESIWCIIGFFILNKIGKNRRFKGQLVLGYGIWYGFERGFLELIRTDSLMLGKIKVSSLLSFVLCITCVVITVLVLKKQRVAVEQTTYSSQFEENIEETNYILEEENGEDN